MTAKPKTIAIVNGTGRQAASLIRVASAIGYFVRAQVFSREGLVAEELTELPGVTLFEGALANNGDLINALFTGAQYAFINTTYLAGDEVAIGRALANAAKKAGTIQHYVYSSMPDHSIHSPNWPSLPLWSCKFAVENYIRQIGLPATFVYAGIYNNNFTSLPYPLFCLDLKPEGHFVWRAPFHPDIELPWLDAEHDVGPAVIQIFKDGAKRWNGHRIALAFELLTPRQVCQAFARALNRPCHYVFEAKIEICVPIPTGYKEQLDAIEILFGQQHAPYFPGPEFTFTRDPADRVSFDLPIREAGFNRSGSTATAKRVSSGSRDIPSRSEVRSIATKKAPPSPARAASKSPGSPTQSSDRVVLTSLVDEARNLWEGWRGMEEYAREVFPIEEENNGLDWMKPSVGI